MREKIKRFIEKIKTRIFYNRCYDKMEGLAIAVFGMCSGAYVSEYRKDKCANCPYFNLEVETEPKPKEQQNETK